MIRAYWQDPNVRFKATDAKGVAYDQICFTDNKQALSKRLTEMGLKDLVITDYDFAEWRTRAAAAKDKVVWQRIKHRWSYFQQQARDRWGWLSDGDIVEIGGTKNNLISKLCEHDNCTEADSIAQIDAWSANLTEETPPAGTTLPKTAISFNDKVWKELKWHLFDLFHNKCAYCESKPLAASYGDVEHYRPKGKVDEDPNHPGYYWLAYDEHNLLPSCSLCNQPDRAKLTHFPVKGFHSHEPRNIGVEEPLLLNPFDPAIDPFDHLEFDAAGFSQPHDRSLYGKASREIYDLDRPGLKDARFQEMQLVEEDWITLIGRVASVKDAYLELKHRITRGERVYSAAQLWELDRARARMIQELMNLTPMR